MAHQRPYKGARCGNHEQPWFKHKRANSRMRWKMQDASRKRNRYK